MHAGQNQCNPNLKTRVDQMHETWITWLHLRQSYLCMSHWWTEEVDNLRCVILLITKRSFEMPRCQALPVNGTFGSKHRPAELWCHDMLFSYVFVPEWGYDVCDLLLESSLYISLYSSCWYVALPPSVVAPYDYPICFMWGSFNCTCKTQYALQLEFD